MTLDELLDFCDQPRGCSILLMSISNSLALSLFGSFEEDAAVIDASDIFPPHNAVGGPYEQIGCDPCSDRFSIRDPRWISTLVIKRLPSVTRNAMHHLDHSHSSAQAVHPKKSNTILCSFQKIHTSPRSKPPLWLRSYFAKMSSNCWGLKRP